jgi:hypothetical protein
MQANADQGRGKIADLSSSMLLGIMHPTSIRHLIIQLRRQRRSGFGGSSK